LFAFALCIIVIIGQGADAFTGQEIDWKTMIATYMSVPLFLLLWLGYKWTKRTKIVPLKECDLSPDASSDK
jgi:lysine-specific permease